MRPFLTIFLFAQSALAQVPSPAAEQTFFLSQTFAEAILFAELPALPEEKFENGFLYQVEFFVNKTPKTRLFWASCAGDGENGIPSAYVDGDQMLFHG